MGWWNRFAELALNEGYVLALAMTCMLQYAAYVHLRNRSRRHASLLNAEVNELKTELSDVQRDRAFVRLENQLVREFVTQPDIERSLSRLLKEFVPDSRYGFAIYLELHNDEFVIRQSRGNAIDVNRIIPISADLLRRLATEKLVTWTGKDLLTSSIALMFHKDDLRNVETPPPDSHHGQRTGLRNFGFNTVVPGRNAGRLATGTRSPNRRLHCPSATKRYAAAGPKIKIAVDH